MQSLLIYNYLRLLMAFAICFDIAKVWVNMLDMVNMLEYSLLFLPHALRVT